MWPAKRSVKPMRSEDARGGGVEKGGGRKTSRMTPLPKSGSDPHRLVRFPPPLWCRSAFFLVKKRKTDQTRRSFRGVQKFLEGALFGTFSSLHTFCTPPHVMAQCIAGRRSIVHSSCFPLLKTGGFTMDRGPACPKDPAVLKIIRRINSLSPYQFTLSLEISCAFSPGKQGISETETLPYYFTTVVYFSQRRSKLI